MHLSISVPVPQIQEQIVEVIKVTLQEQMSKRIVEQIVDVPMPQILEQIVDVPVPVLQIQEQIVAVGKALFERHTRFVFLSHSRSPTIKSP